MAIVNPTTGLVYRLGYISLDGNVIDQMESFDINLDDGGKDVYTLALGRAGRLMGAPSSTFTFNGSIPADTPNVGGAGMESAGMVTGYGIPIDQTLLTAYNTNAQRELSIIMYIGTQTNYIEQLNIYGYVTKTKYAGKVGDTLSFMWDGSGSFAIFQP